MATSGNVAFPFAPTETALGPFCEFNIYHVMPLEDPLSNFPITYVDISHASRETNGHGTNGHSSAPSAASKAAKALKHSLVFPETIKPSFRDLISSGRTSAPLSDVAHIIRSKNAGPYENTFDVMFNNDEEYRWVQTSGILNKQTLSAAYNVKPEAIVTCMFFDPAKAFKLTIPRKRVQG